MENNLIIRIINKGVYYQIAIIQIHATWESTILAFGKEFLLESDAEKFTKSKGAKSVLKAAQKLIEA